MFHRVDGVGWGKPSQSRKWHWFKADGRSLCGRYANIGRLMQLELGVDDSSDNCVSCKRKLEKMLDKLKGGAR